MHNCSKNVTVKVRNSMAYPQTLKIQVARVVAANWVPEPQIQPEMRKHWTRPKASRHGSWPQSKNRKSCSKVILSGLESWQPKLADSAWSLLAEYHDIFSLEPCKFSCTHLTEHVIKVTNDAPFKEWFSQIPLPLVEDIHAHLWEMLDSGMIYPSHSVWFNTVVLVWKKDRSLHFCINFCHLNIHMKNDSYTLPRIQKALESLVGAGHFSCWDLKSGFWQIKMDEPVKAVYHIYCWQPGLLQVWSHTFWSVQCASHISEVNAKLHPGAESNILSLLPWQYNCFLADGWGTPPPLVNCLWPIYRAQLKIKAIQGWLFSEMKSPT